MPQVPSSEGQDPVWADACPVLERGGDCPAAGHCQVCGQKGRCVCEGVCVCVCVLLFVCVCVSLVICVCVCVCH